MRYHDYHLVGYKVLDRGEKLTLDLIYDYPAQEKFESQITFEDVAIYNFTHTEGAIITFIEEVRLPQLLKRIGPLLSEWSSRHGLRKWQGDLTAYEIFLVSNNYKAWEIESAIGFDGFVIAKSVSGN